MTDVPTFATWLTLIAGGTAVGEDFRPVLRKGLKDNPGVDPVDVIALFIEREWAWSGDDEQPAPLVSFEPDRELAQASDSRSKLIERNLSQHNAPE